MNAMVEPQAFVLPKKPKVKEQEAPPDQRKFAVIPIRACTDPQLTLGMMRSLQLICSYMNRSGITWVSQKKLSEDLKVSQQAISKHLVKLVKAGYLEVLRKAYPGERSTTWRVIFDPSIKAEDAVAITSALEDTRPPYMKEQQAREAEQPDPQGQRRIAELVAKALRQPTKKEPTMAQPGQSRYVKKMKEEIEQHKAKRSAKAAQAQPPEVVQQSEPQIQPPEVVRSTTSRGCAEHIFNIKKEYLKDSVLNNQNRAELREAGLTDQQIDDNLAHLLDAYQAEGMTPAPDRLVGEILQLAKVGL